MPSEAETRASEHLSVRTVAFFLPQFHPIPENDEAWGAGFTEWNNVVRSRARHKGQQQPRLPTDLGFYDLRLPATRDAQSRLATSYGVDAFCWYHYWFNGKRVLERPFEDVLKTGEPRLPFMLCWANENWTRRWDGKDSDVILEQRYDSRDDLAHIEALLPALDDSRYVKVNGRPLLLIFKASEIPDVRSTLRIWRDVTRAHGLDLCLGRVESTIRDRGNPERLGFDCSVDFQPHLFGVTRAFRTRLRQLAVTTGVTKQHLPGDTLRDFRRTVNTALDEKQIREWRRYPCVAPSWDNTPRRSRGAVVYRESSPELYGEWLRAALTAELHRPDNGLVFVNAWNEWAEGAILEPCDIWGRGYLEAHSEAVRRASRSGEGNERAW